MPNQKTMKQIELAELFLSVNASRAVGDLFKMPADFVTAMETRLTDLRTKDDATLTQEGDRAAASGKVRISLDKLGLYLRDGYNFLKGIGSYAISDPERLGVFTHYGWAQGELGILSDDRIESLAHRAISATPTVGNAAWQYPAPLLALITTELATLNLNQPIALTGNRQAAIVARDLALELLQTANDRVRFYYCYASDDEDRTKELARIGRQPRRPRTANGGLSAPGDLNLEANDDLTVSADWEDVDNVDHYVLSRQRVGLDSAFVEEPTTFYDSEATIGPFDAGRTVRVKVRAVRDNEESNDSSVAEVTVSGAFVPAAPAAPVLVTSTPDQVHISWTLVFGAQFYKVFRLVIGLDQDYVEVGPASGPSSTVIDLPPNATVRIRLKACNSQGDSLPGPYLETVLPPPPS